MKVELMSSEESNDDDEFTIIVKPLPWRSLKVTRFFEALDDAGAESKTAQARRQRRQRVIGATPSERSVPAALLLPSWVCAAVPN